MCGLSLLLRLLWRLVKCKVCFEVHFEHLSLALKAVAGLVGNEVAVKILLGSLKVDVDLAVLFQLSNHLQIRNDDVHLTQHCEKKLAIKINIIDLVTQRMKCRNKTSFLKS